MKTFNYTIACLTAALFFNACGVETEEADTEDLLTENATPSQNKTIGTSSDAVVDSTIPPSNAGFTIVGYVDVGPIKTGYRLKNNTTGTCVTNASGTLNTTGCSTDPNQYFALYNIAGTNSYWVCRQGTLAAVNNADVCKSRWIGPSGPPYDCATYEKKDVLQATCYETNSWNSDFKPNGGKMNTVVLSTKAVGSTGGYVAREDKYYPTLLSASAAGKLNLRLAPTRYFVSENAKIKFSDNSKLIQQTWTSQ